MSKRANMIRFRQRRALVMEAQERIALAENARMKRRAFAFSALAVVIIFLLFVAVS